MTDDHYARAEGLLERAGSSTTDYVALAHVHALLALSDAVTASYAPSPEPEPELELTTGEGWSW